MKTISYLSFLFCAEKDLLLTARYTYIRMIVMNYAIEYKEMIHVSTKLKDFQIFKKKLRLHWKENVNRQQENITRTGRKNIEQDLMAVMELKQMFEVCFSEQKAPGRKKCQASEHATVFYLKTLHQHMTFLKF